MSKESEHPLESVLEKALEETGGEEDVSVGEIMDMYADRSFGPIFTLLGLLTVIPPLGGIPGLPAIVGAVIILFSAQMLLGLNHVWLPDFLEDMFIKRDKVETAHDKSEDTLEKIDSLITERLEWATSGPARYAAAVLVTLMAAIMIPLELVPFAVAIPGLAISLVGVALIARDGALMLAAYALSAIALGVLVYYSPLM